ncbi:MAG: hypothetical protein IK137_02025 [Bacilli bacterium]|nr:hypothetical protein [Bacilli bacterium]
MSVIINFTKEEAIKLKENWQQYNQIGKPGNEGKCYLINNEVYKIYNDNYELEKYTSNPICKDDLNLESFLFPEEIYTYGKENYVFAYKTTPYVEKDVLKISLLRKHIIPDINKIKEALKVLIKDIYILSRNNIYAVDLAKRNMLFDGEKFYVIDTLDYDIVDEYTYLDNIELLKKAINCFILDCNIACEAYDISKEEIHLDECKDLINYINRIAIDTQEELDTKEVQKIKRP